MASWLIRRRIPALILFIFMTMFLSVGILNIRIDYDYERFFPQGDEDVDFFKKFQSYFPQNDEVLYIALGPKQGPIWQDTFLVHAQELTEELQAFPHVDSVSSLLQLQLPKRTGISIRQIPVLKNYSRKELLNARKTLAGEPILKQSLVSKNERFIGIFVMLDPQVQKSGAPDSLYAAIEDKLKSSGLTYVISGIPGIRTQYIRKVGTELVVFTGLSILLILFFLWVSFRTWWGMVVPLAGVVFPVIWLIGLMGWLNVPLDITTALLPTILFIAGISDIVHITSHFLSAYRKGYGRRKALLITFKEMGTATFLANFASAVSLISLVLTEFEPLQQFGLFAAIGVMITYLIAFMILPGLLYYLPEKELKKSVEKKLLKVNWERSMLSIAKFNQKNRWGILSVTTVIIIASIWGITLISTNVRLLDEVGEDDPIRKQVQFFEEQLVGVRNLEVAITPKSGHHASDPNILKEIDAMERWIEKEPECEATFSLASVYRKANQIYHFGRKEYNELPKDSTLQQEIKLAAGSQGAMSYLVTPDDRLTRITARMPDLGSEKMNEFANRLKFYIQHNRDTSLFEYRLTGTALLVEKNNAFLTSGLKTELGFSILIIVATLLLLFRNPRMLLAAVIPNLLPVIILLGIMGFAGISLKASTVIVISLCFGIAFDDTIHFLARMKIEIGKGALARLTIRQLLTRTLVECGEGIVLTSAAMCCGFLLLIFSEFNGTFYVGLFSSLTLIIAVLSELFLHPVLQEFLLRKNRANELK